MKNSGQVDVEMQVAAYEYWAERTLFYLSKMFTEQIHEGEGYDVLEKCIHIGILDFEIFEDTDAFYSRFHLWEDSRHIKYSDKLELHVLELPKLAKHQYPETELLSWMQFINAETEEEFKMAAEKDPYIEKAYESLVHLSADERARLEYEAREKALRDYNSQMSSARRRGEAIGKEIGEKIGKEIGIKLGEKSCEERIILNMHQLGKSAEEISVLTGCSEKIVLEVLNHSKNNLEKEN